VFTLKIKIFVFFLLLILFRFAPLHSQTETGEIPSPKEFSGFTPGADFHIANYTQILSYFRMLDKKSDRIRIEEMGPTTEDRPLILAIISSPQNLLHSQQIIENRRKLADPRTIDKEQAKELLCTGKVLVSINCSIHPKEIGPGQMSMQLAYRLATGNTEEIKTILDNVVVLLIPVHNPDGLDKVAAWYDEYRGTEYEAGPLPFLGQKYCGHDINRDWIALTQNETRLTVEKVYNVWQPHIVFDLHQMGARGARLFLPPYTDPYDEMIDPILQAQMAELGAAVTADLTAAGKRGVANNIKYDAYSPARAYINYHGGIRFLGEIASCRLASPITINPGQFQVTHFFDPAKRSWRQPSPWPGGTWRLANIVDYAQQASLSILRYAAHNRQNWLEQSYRSAIKSVSPGDDKPTFLISPQQHDPFAVCELLKILRRGMVEIYRAKNDFVVDDTNYPAGTIVLPAAQPAGAYLRTLFEVRPYPSVDKNGKSVPVHPYDVTAYNLPLFFGVAAKRTFSKINANLEYLNQIAPLRGRINGTSHGKGYFLEYNSNQAVKVLQWLYDKSTDIFWLADTVRVDGKVFQPGTIWINFSAASLIQKVTNEFSLNLWYADNLKNVKKYRLRKPRVALYQSNVASTDEGWTRYIFETFGIDYVTVKNADIKKGALHKRFDAILLPDQSKKIIVNGWDSSVIPPQFCGGIGLTGVESLKQFVNDGGTLVALNRATSLPIDYFHLHVINATTGFSTSEYNVPGSLLKIIINNTQPLGYGLPKKIAVFNDQSPAFLSSKKETIGSYPGERLLLNGWLDGEKKLIQKSAIVEISMGKGVVILSGCRPQFRALSQGTYKLIFNALIKSSAKKVNFKK